MNCCDKQDRTEECPLTQDRNNKWKLSTCCGGGLKFIVCCYIILSIAITCILVLQLVYDSNVLQGISNTHGAVATDYTNCSQIGTRILRKGGNAVDAAIAATICMTVVAPHKTGLGSAGYMLIYDHKDNTVPLIIDFVRNTTEGIFGTLGIRIPALLRALEVAHSLQGILPWHDVVEPAAILAKLGFQVSKEFEHEILSNNSYGILYAHVSAGDTLSLQLLADTLYAVAKYGTIVLYNGTLSEKIFQDEIRKEELLKQLAMYQPEITPAKKSIFYEHSIYYPSESFSFKSSIEALEQLGVSVKNASTLDSLTAVVRSLLHSNISLMNVKNVKEAAYTGVMVVDSHDTYVSVVTGLSKSSGSLYMTGAGFLLDSNNSTTDPLTTLIPIIFHNEKRKCELRGVFGTDDVILGSQMLYDIIVRALNISTVIEQPRYYLLSDGLAIENDQGHTLETILHDELRLFTMSSVDASSLTKSVNAIVKRKDFITSHSDSRGGGLASILNI